MPTFSPGLDVVGPGLLAAVGATLAAGVIAVLVVVFVEGLVIRAFGLGGFGRALLLSLAMNVVSFIVGILFAILLTQINGWLWLVLGFALSVGVEGGVLALANHSRPGRALAAALVANLVTYVPIGLLLALGGGLFNA